MITLPSPSAAGSGGHDGRDGAGADTDTELLQAFARQGDSQAFSRLVERYVSLVFGTACRRTQSRELAQEAAQNTFCQLARQAARLKEGGSLAPWLHRVALREAGTLLRHERSRQRTLDRFAQSVGADECPVASRRRSGSGTDIGTGFGEDQPAMGGMASPAGEQLDEALASLREPERRAVILRYLQGLSLRELARAEATSEEAVRKRVSRALDRLAALLARRGITAPAMMSCLAPFPIRPAVPCSAIAARAVRDAASATVTATATAAATLSVAGLMGFAASWWPAAAVFLATAIPVALLPGTEAGPAAALSSIAAGNTAPPPAPGRIPGRGAGRTDGGRGQELARRIGSLKREEGGASHLGYSMLAIKVFAPWIGGQSHAQAVERAALRRAVLDLSGEEVRLAIATLREKSGNTEAIGALFARWAELDPEEALRAAAARQGKEGYQEGCFAVLKEMARTDLSGALTWAKAHIPGSERALVWPLATTDPAAYVRIMESPLMKPDQPSADGSPYYEILPADPDTALKGLRQRELEGSLDSVNLPSLAYMGNLEPGQAETLRAFAMGLPPDSKLRVNCLQAAAFLLSFTSPAEAVEALADSLASSSTGPEVSWRESLTLLLTDWNARDPAGACRWYQDHGASRLKLDPEVQEAIAKKAGLSLPSITASAPVSTP